MDSRPAPKTHPAAPVLGCCAEVSPSIAPIPPVTQSEPSPPVWLGVLPVRLRARIAQRPCLLKILGNIGWLSLDKALRMGVGLIVGVWVARYLGPEQFGLLNFASAFTGLFGAIATLGLSGIVVRDIVRDPAGKEETLGTAAVLQLFGGLIAYGLILVTIFWLRPDDTLAKAIVAILGSMMLFKASEVAVYWFESQVLSKYTVWVQNGVFLVFAAIKVVLILRNAPLIAFARAAMAEALVVAVLMLVMLGLRGPKLRQLKITLARAKGLLADSWPLILSAIAVTIYMKIDQIMLGQMIGDEAVGIYSAAVRVSEVWYFIPMVIVASVFPAILEAKKCSEAKYYARLQSLFDLMSLISMPVAIAMTFLSPFVIDLLFGAAYSEAGFVLAIHIWASIFVFLGVANSKWFLAENLQKLIFFRTLLNGLINVALNYLLIPEYGAVGAAIALVVAQSAGTFIYDHFRADTRRLFYMKVSSFNFFRVFYKRSLRLV